MACEKETCVVECTHPRQDICCPQCDMCFFEGGLYDNGQSFQPDDCKRCLCLVSLRRKVLDRTSAGRGLFSHMTAGCVQLWMICSGSLHRRGLLTYRTACVQLWMICSRSLHGRGLLTHRTACVQLWMICSGSLHGQGLLTHMTACVQLWMICSGSLRPLLSYMS